MAYTTKDEVAADFKDITFANGDSISDTDVIGFISESDALIDSYISNRYTTPVSGGPVALNLLKLLSRSLTAARVKRILEVKQEKNADPNQNVLGVLLPVSKVMQILEDLKNGDANLIDAVENQGANGFYSQNVAGGVCFTAKKDEQQW